MHSLPFSSDLSDSPLPLSPSRRRQSVFLAIVVIPLVRIILGVVSDKDNLIATPAGEDWIDQAEQCRWNKLTSKIATTVPH